MPATWMRTTTRRKKYRPTAMPTPRNKSAVDRRTRIETGLTCPRLAPTTIESKTRLKMSSTTAAPRIV